MKESHIMVITIIKPDINLFLILVLCSELYLRYLIKSLKYPNEVDDFIILLFT